MMATTHALVGVLLASVTTAVAPELTPVALASAVGGSVFPDFDLYAGHRKTLHYPVYYSAFAVPAALAAVAVPVVATAAVAFFLAGAALHSLSDALGGGLELRPWEATSDRAVYDHYRGRWVPPRRWVRYDGAPEDLLLAVAVAAPSFALYGGVVRSLVVAVLAASAGYALLRKPLASLWERLVTVLPDEVRASLPERFRRSNAGASVDADEAGVPVAADD